MAMRSRRPSPLTSTASTLQMDSGNGNACRCHVSGLGCAAITTSAAESRVIHARNAMVRGIEQTGAELAFIIGMPVSIHFAHFRDQFPFGVGPHLGARRRLRTLVGANFKARTKVRPYNSRVVSRSVETRWLGACRGMVFSRFIRAIRCQSDSRVNTALSHYPEQAPGHQAATASRPARGIAERPE